MRQDRITLLNIYDLCTLFCHNLSDSFLRISEPFKEHGVKEYYICYTETVVSSVHCKSYWFWPVSFPIGVEPRKERGAGRLNT